MIDLIRGGILAVWVASRAFAGGNPNPSRAAGQPPRPRAKDGGAKETYEPSDRYDVRWIEGWTVLVNKRFLIPASETCRRDAVSLARATSPDCGPRPARGRQEAAHNSFLGRRKGAAPPVHDLSPQPHMASRKRHEPRKGSLCRIVQRS